MNESSATETGKLSEEDAFLVDAICSLSRVASTATENASSSSIKKTNRNNEKPKSGSKSSKSSAAADNRPIVAFNIRPPKGFVFLANSDPRYQMPSKLNEAYLSGNITKFRQLLVDHCEPDVKFSHQYDGEHNPYGPNRRDVVGVDGIVLLYSLLLQAAPDILSKLSELVGHHNPKTGDAFISCRITSYSSRTKRVMETVDGPVVTVKRVKVEKSIEELMDTRQCELPTTQQPAQTLSKSSDDSSSSEINEIKSCTSSSSAGVSSRDRNVALGGNITNTESCSNSSTNNSNSSTNNNNSTVVEVIESTLSTDKPPLVLQPLSEPERGVASITDGRYTFEFNARHKITQFGLFFKVTKP